MYLSQCVYRYTQYTILYIHYDAEKEKFIEEEKESVVSKNVVDEISDEQSDGSRR